MSSICSFFCYFIKLFPYFFLVWEFVISKQTSSGLCWGKECGIKIAELVFCWSESTTDLAAAGVLKEGGYKCTFVFSVIIIFMHLCPGPVTIALYISALKQCSLFQFAIYFLLHPTSTGAGINGRSFSIISGLVLIT